MSRVLLGLLLIALLGGAGFLFTRYEIRRQDGAITIRPLHAQGNVESDPDLPPPPLARKTIRIATFHITALDSHKLQRDFVASYLVDLVRRFDLVAVQGVQARNQGVLMDFVEKINAGGHHYDFATGPEVGREPTEHYSAFLFDKATIEIDRDQVYTVDDPQQRFGRKPLVGLFRARGPEAAEAFTFRLVNVHLLPDRVDMELDLLDDVLGAVRRSAPQEDDVILLGDVETDERGLGQLGQVPRLTWAVADTLSTTRGTKLADNLFFDRRATSEFTGRSGVVDLIREFNLTMQQAVEISAHMPVWAEFSVHEGGQLGHLPVEAK